MITKEMIERKRLIWKMLLLPLFLPLFLWHWLKFIFTSPIMRPGIHAITGDTGSGKTLLASIVSRRFSQGGRKVYANSAFNGVVKTFEITDIFDNMEMVSDELVKTEGEPPKVVIFDEIQRDFNKRMNRKREYNDIFIPLIEWLATHRHNGVTHVYFITQSWNRLDIQLQDFIQRVHMVTGRKRPSLAIWIRDKKFKPIVRPFKILFYSRRKKDLEMDDIQQYVNRKRELRYKKIKPSKIKVSLQELADFNTHAFKNALILKTKPELTTQSKNTP